MYNSLEHILKAGTSEGARKAWIKRHGKKGSTKPDSKPEEVGEKNFEWFKQEYEGLLKEMFKYGSGQVGSQYFAEKLGKLSDSYPDFMNKYDDL